jgi:2-oxoisovalerate dehydrogenase E2 component (dihydrolipoyl transacylase)
MSVVAGARVFTLPDLGEGLTEAEIVRWRVAVGDIIEVDQSVVEVETAKALVDVPCPYAGRIVVLHGLPGDRRPVGQPLVTVEPVAEAQPAPGDSGNVLIGYGTGHGEPAVRRRRRVSAGASPAVHGLPAAASAGLVISPLVRRLARERGVDLSALHGTGPGGIIRRIDVESARSAQHHDDELAIPLVGVRRAIAEKLSRSRREIPDVTIWVDVDATGLLDARATINVAAPDRSVSILALLARICVSGLRRFPQLNARVDQEREQIVQSSRIHLGIAAQTDRGLVVPVVRDAQLLDTLELAAALAQVTADARAGTLAPASMTGGTFTLNNYGVFGVDGSTPIINHPEAALLGIGRIVDKPWVVDGQLAVRKVAQLGLTFDHRVCDGGVAGGFVRYVADCVERPALLIANL